MAYYDFACGKCRKRFTLKLSFEEHAQKSKRKCPKCGSRKVEQRLSEIFVKTSKKS